MDIIRNIMLTRGAEALSDEELLGVVVGDSATAAALLAQYGSLQGVVREDIARLRMTAGLGITKACQLKAAAEVGRRVASRAAEAVQSITASEDVARIFRPLLVGLHHEECWALYLTSANRVVERVRLSTGGVQETVVDVRLLVKRALELLSTKIILVHNHPSGSAVASASDKALTQRVQQACRLFDIELLDHIIISAEGDYSFKHNNLL